MTGRWSNPPQASKPVPGWAHPPRPVPGHFGDHVMTAFAWIDDAPPRVRSVARVVCANCGVDSGNHEHTATVAEDAAVIAAWLVKRWGSSCEAAAQALRAAEVMET